MRQEECMYVCCELNFVFPLLWWYSSTFGRSVMMHFIRSVDSTFNPVWAAGSREVLLHPQPHLVFVTTTESGLTASWAHREPRLKWWLKISTWKGRLWEEQQAQSDALIGVSVQSSGEEALRSISRRCILSSRAASVQYQHEEMLYCTPCCSPSVCCWPVSSAPPLVPCSVWAGERRAAVGARLGWCHWWYVGHSFLSCQRAAAPRI